MYRNQLEAEIRQFFVAYRNVKSTASLKTEATVRFRIVDSRPASKYQKDVTAVIQQIDGAYCLDDFYLSSLHSSPMAEDLTA